MAQRAYPMIIFDWGDTVIYDDPTMAVPVVEWTEIKVIEGILDVLTDLQASGRCIIMATGALVSDEIQIHAALARVNLDSYFSKIYCFKNTGHPKGEEFYRHILADLNVPATDVIMVGDSFAKDVQIPNALGIFAVWFNPRPNEMCNSELHTTVHSMFDLRTFFRMLG
jgi:putative hydrolase of the HAD superfamily